MRSRGKKASPPAPRAGPREAARRAAFDSKVCEDGGRLAAIVALVSRVCSVALAARSCHTVLKRLTCCGPGAHPSWSGRNRPFCVVSRLSLGLNSAHMRDSRPLLHQVQVTHDTGTAAHVSRPEKPAKRTHQECKHPCACTALSGAPSIFAYFLMVPPSHAGGPFA